MNSRVENTICGFNFRKSLTVSMLVVALVLAIFSDGCSSFICQSTSSKPSHLVLPTNQHIKPQLKQKPCARNGKQVIRTTKLYAQKKKPRFSQKGSHIAQSTSQRISRGNSAFKGKNKRNNNTPTNRKGKRRSPPIQKHQPWASGKSIDDLESTMSKRWGTLDDSSTSMAGSIPDGFEIFDGNENDSKILDGYNNSSDENMSSAKKKDSDSSRWTRPVFDPWDEKERMESNRDNNNDNMNRFAGEREYYDQDDEGYEISGGFDEDGILFEDNKSLKSSEPSYVPRVDHLISARPAGGRGTNRNDINSNSGGGYFFNPNAAADSAATTRKNEDLLSSRNEQPNNTSNFDVSRSNTKGGDEKSKRRTRSSLAKPLLDDTTGKPRLLTIEEAFNRFQGSIDEGTMEIIETAEIPILAKKANALSWDDLGITSTVLLENLQYNMNCPHPLSVQEKSTPAILTRNDVMVGTYTGSGKTLAFLVPIVQRLLWDLLDDTDDNDKMKINPGLAVIIVAPGRELASQIASVTRDLLQDTGLKVQLAIGGTTFKRNLEQLRKRKPNIVVGTPGRIAELVVGKPGEKTGRLKIGALQSLVLDEFDALLEYKAHRDPTRAIVQSLKRRHGNGLQAVLCSATATDVMNSSKVTDFLRPGFETVMADDDDVLVTNRRSKNDVSYSSAIAAQVSRTVMHGVVNVPHKRMALDAVRKILHTEPIPQQILIFVENARKVDIVVEKLADRGIIAAPLHGGMGSEKMDRAEVSRALREGYVGIVVATELAARGLDAPLLTHVINLDLPTDASHYAHRSGRCGRGGRPGVVINITTSPKERKVPKRFTDTLGVEMFTAETRGGKLVLVDPSTQILDKSR
mmetsp:Transcript_22269/g.52937  ORF Transcript_22269/g.52937 Transcript_22269/m.52937 type:complete len:859 (-) Transcript_22269:39-2615(-)